MRFKSICARCHKDYKREPGALMEWYYSPKLSVRTDNTLCEPCAKALEIALACWWKL